MPEYRFKAIDAAGKVVRGQSSAVDSANLAGILQDQGLFLMESEQAVVIAASAPAPASAAKAGLHGALDGLRARLALRSAKRKITPKEVAFLTGQLAVMIRSALPILESLELLAAQAPNPAFRVVLQDIARSVSEGMPLSQAFGRHPELFDDVYLSLLAAGEVGGELDEMLKRLTAHMNFQLKLKSSIKSVLAYPAVVVMVSLAVVGFLVVFVLPTFIEIFKELKIDLPLPTRILIFVSENVRRYWWALLGSLPVGWLALKRWLRDPDHARLAQRWQLAMPIIGPLTLNIILTRVLRTMGSLIESGISIIKSLELARNAAGNLVFSDLLEQIGADVHDGKPLSQAFAESPLIPPVVIGMLATGERTGTLPEVISRVAEFYEAETETAIKDLFSAIEPLFIVFLGLMVGGMAVSVLLPMFDVAQGIK